MGLNQSCWYMSDISHQSQFDTSYILYYLTKLDWIKHIAFTFSDTFKKCSFCLNAFTTSNRSIRLLPKPALDHKIKKLLQKHNTTSNPLGNFQTKLVQDYINRKNTLVSKTVVLYLGWRNSSASKNETRGTYLYICISFS